jgi:hypothetical protein
MMVPIGVFMATSSGATQYTASCSGGAGTISNVLIDNGVGDNGGLLLQAQGPQQYRVTATGNTCTGNAVSGGDVSAVVTTATAVNCANLLSNAVQLGGSGTFTWTAPPGMGTSNFNIRFEWTSNTSLHFWGSVSAGESTNNVFGGNHISGNITTTESLAAVGNGGSCSATNPLSSFTITGISWNISAS